MARQVLDNGVILPSEFSDDWYEDMTTNLTKLDEVIGSDAEKLDETDVGEAAISNDYDDLDNKPDYNVLRRAAVTLTAGGTGNYSDLDSTSKIKAGDYVLDAANKLYSITAIDTANSTYTVSAAAIINITDKSELGAAALSNDYTDLDNKPDLSPYDQHLANNDIHVTAADKTTWNTVTSKADDNNVMHLTGNESAAGNKNFEGVLSTLPLSTLWPEVTNTTEDITAFTDSSIHLEYKSSGKLSDLSGGAWGVVALGIGCFFFRFNSGTDIRFKHFPTNTVNRIPIVSGANRFINDVTPNKDNTYNLGGSSLRWKTFNDINPGALSMPNLAAGLDISSALVNAGSPTPSEYTPTVNGWIVIKIGAASGVITMRAYSNGGLDNYAYSERSDICDTTGSSYARFTSMTIPCIANDKVYIIIMPSTASVVSAKFYPNLGNV